MFVCLHACTRGLLLSLYSSRTGLTTWRIRLLFSYLAVAIAAEHAFPWCESSIQWSIDKCRSSSVAWPCSVTVLIRVPTLRMKLKKEFVRTRVRDIVGWLQVGVTIWIHRRLSICCLDGDVRLMSTVATSVPAWSYRLLLRSVEH